MRDDAVLRCALPLGRGLGRESLMNVHDTAFVPAGDLCKQLL